MIIKSGNVPNRSKNTDACSSMGARESETVDDRKRNRKCNWLTQSFDGVGSAITPTFISWCENDIVLMAM